MMARAATSEELGFFRSDGQWEKFSIYLHVPTTIFTAVVDSVTAGVDPVVEVNYLNGVGSTGDVLEDMTCLVGTTAGASDIGFVRVRSIDGSKITIGEASDISWVGGLCLTVIDDFEYWAKKLSFLGGVYKIESDVAYTDQFTSMAPVPVMGPYIRVVELVGETLSVTTRAYQSWVPDGSGVDSWSWDCSGPSVVDTIDDERGGFTVIFNQTGLYRIRCGVTANGKTSTGYRYIRVYDAVDDPRITGFSLQNLNTSQAEGVSFQIDWYNIEDISLLKDRMSVVLLSENHYGNSVADINPLGDYAGNIFTLGRVESGSISFDSELKKITFSVQGNTFWMKAATAWPFVLMDTHATLPGQDVLEVDWMHIDNLTVDKALWVWALYRSTITRSTDIYPSGDEKRAFSCAGNLGPLFDQITGFSEQIGAAPITDRYGRLFVEIDPQLLPVTAPEGMPQRGDVLIVMHITKTDWMEQIQIKKLDHSPIGWYQMGGFYYNGNTFDTMLATAPGNALKQYGTSQSKSNFVVSSQEQCNEFSGLLLAKENNPFSSVIIPLVANNQLIDVAPNQYITISLEPSDTPLGVTWDHVKLIVRKINYTWDDQTGSVTPILECEAEVSGPPGVTIIPPALPANNLPPFKPFTFAPVSLLPPYHGTTYSNPQPNPPQEPEKIPTPNCAADLDAPANGPWTLFYGGILEQYDYYIWNRLNGTIRSNDHVNKTSYQINGRFQERNLSTNLFEDTDADDFYVIEAYAYSPTTGLSTLISTGVHDALGSNKKFVRTGKFPVPASTRIDWYKLTIPGTFNVDHVEISYGFLGHDTPLEIGPWGWGMLMTGGIYIWWKEWKWFLSNIDKSDLSFQVIPAGGEIWTGQYFEGDIKFFPRYWDSDIVYIDLTYIWNRPGNAIGGPALASRFYPATSEGIAESLLAKPLTFQGLFSSAGSIGTGFPGVNIGTESRGGDTGQGHGNVWQWGQIILNPISRWRIILDNVLLWNLCP
jgi:hypothetical protein